MGFIREVKEFFKWGLTWFMVPVIWFIFIALRSVERKYEKNEESEGSRIDNSW